MQPGTANFTIKEGDVWNDVITLRDSSNALINLTGYTAKLQARRTINSSTTVISLTESSGLTLGGAAGTITLAMTSAQTAALDFDQAVYELEITSGGGSTYTMLEGVITLSREVAR